jgi:chromosome segregation ATPase
LTLETTMKSKDKLIQRWEEDLKKEREIVELKTSKFNKQKEKMSTKYANLGYNADTSESESESELKKKLNEAMDKLKQVNEMEELLLKMKEPIDGSQLIHIILAETEQFKKKFKHILELQRNLNEEKQKYEDLRVKYEILEEEHAVTKATLVIARETLKNQLLYTKPEFQELEAELKALRKRYNKHQLDHMRLRSCLERKRSELDQLKKENEVINDQLEHMRKESDELKEKLDSYEKVNKVTRSKAKSRSTEEPNEFKSLKKELMKVKHPLRFDFKMAFFVLFLSLFFFFFLRYYYLFFY